MMTDQESHVVTDPVELAANLRFMASQIIEVAANLERGSIVDIFDRTVPYRIDNARVELGFMGVEVKAN